MRRYSLDNDDCNYLFCIIDVFTKFAFVFPIHNKEAQTIAIILKSLFDDNIKPLILLSDNGSEFIAEVVKRVCEGAKVHLITSYPYIPLGIIERFNKTIKSKIFAYMAIHKTLRYIDDLKAFVANYNRTKHHTIKDYPYYVHLCDLEQKECKQANAHVKFTLQDIDAKMNAPVLNHITPLQIDDQVRVVAYFKKP